MKSGESLCCGRRLLPICCRGVSGWINSLTKSFPNIEFVLLTIVSDRSLRGKFAYELPENVTEVNEVYLSDYDWYNARAAKEKEYI